MWTLEHKKPAPSTHVLKVHHPKVQARVHIARDELKALAVRSKT